MLVSLLEWPLAPPAHVVDRRFLPTAPRLGYRQALAGLSFVGLDLANLAWPSDCRGCGDDLHLVRANHGLCFVPDAYEGCSAWSLSGTALIGDYIHSILWTCPFA